MKDKHQNLKDINSFFTELTPNQQEQISGGFFRLALPPLPPLPSGSSTPLFPIPPIPPIEEEEFFFPPFPPFPPFLRFFPPR